MTVIVSSEPTQVVTSNSTQLLVTKGDEETVVIGTLDTPVVVPQVTEGDEATVVIGTLDTPVVVPQVTVAITTIEDSATTLVAAALQGPAGPRGLPGPAAGTSVTYEAGESISALKVIKLVAGLAYVASSADLTDDDLVVGVAVTGADVGQDVTVQISGTLQDNVWNWAPGALFLGLSGDITQTPPTSGVLVKVGAPINSNKILIRIWPPDS